MIYYKNLKFLNQKNGKVLNQEIRNFSIRCGNFSIRFGYFSILLSGFKFTIIYTDGWCKLACEMTRVQRDELVFGAWRSCENEPERDGKIVENASLAHCRGVESVVSRTGAR